MPDSKCFPIIFFFVRFYELLVRKTGVYTFNFILIMQISALGWESTWWSRMFKLRSCLII